MPNWCSNTITITGTKESISFLTRVLKGIPVEERGNGNVFETLIGREPSMSKEEYNTGGWYNHNIDWFGTKWDVSYDDCNFDFKDDYIVMYPETAWSPPIGFGIRLHEKYGVDVELYYEESGCDFCGKTIIKDQTVIEQDYSYRQGMYVFDDESFWMNLDSDIEYYAEQESTWEQVQNDYNFVSQKDLEEIKKLYEEKLLELKNEENEN